MNDRSRPLTPHCLLKKMVSKNHVYALECLFLEGSAQKGENVEEAFSKLTKTVIYKIDSGEIPEDIVSAQQRKESSNLKSSEEEAGVEKPGRCSGYYC